MSIPKTKNNQATLLCRVSSEKQAQGYSLDYQAKDGVAYAQRHGLVITRTDRVEESASKDTRKKWREYLERARQGPESHVLIPRVDRSLRNIDDLAEIVKFPKQTGKVLHFFGDGIVYHSESSPAELLHVLIQGAVATWGAAELAVKVKKGMHEKVSQGGWSGRAPLGYLNDKLKKIIHPDPVMAPWIVRAHELAATGKHSLDSIVRTLREEGCTRKLHRSNVAYMLRNTAYYGFNEWPKGSGVLIKGNWEPLISKRLHDEAVRGLERFNKPKYGSRAFAFTGILKCGRCGCAVVGELKKGKYRYWHCTWRRPCTNKTYLREEDVESMIVGNLKDIKLGPALTNRVLGYLERDSANVATAQVTRIATLRQERERLKNRLDKAYDDKLDGKLDENTWANKHRDWQDRMLNLDEQIATLEKSFPGDYMPRARAVLELANACATLYETMPSDKKRELLETLCSNFEMDGKKLIPTWKKPFDLVGRMASCPNWLRD